MPGVRGGICSGRPEGGASGNSWETLSYSVWLRYFTFFETVEDGRVDSARPGPRPSAPALRTVSNSAFLRNCHSCFKKNSCLAKRKTERFPKAIINVFP